MIFEDSGVLSEDTVHLHLEQRVAQRLLARFRAQGFIHGNDEGGRHQLEANMRHWERSLGQFDTDLEHEPERIRRFYEIRRTRVEPVGLVYLWPESN